MGMGINRVEMGGTGMNHETPGKFQCTLHGASSRTSTGESGCLWGLEGLVSDEYSHKVLEVLHPTEIFNG